MTEAALHKVQLGRQSSLGTAVAATTVFPVDAGFTGFELDRATESPDEDFGRVSREQAGRASHGVRWATASLPFVMRFEDFNHALEMHASKISGGTPVGTASPYTWAYAFDETTGPLETALTPYTVQNGVASSTQDEWRGIGVLATDLEFGFDALSAPGNSMWKATAGLVAVDRDVSTMTSSLTPPSVLETMEGHLTVIKEGPVGTAFASLAELAGSLKQFSARSAISAQGRAYGSSSDKATTVGRSEKANIEFDALIGISSTAKTDILDIYNVASGQTTDRRWRLVCTGSGVNTMTIDARVSFRAVNLGDHEGERLYAVSGVFVYDSSLASRCNITITNAVSAFPT